MSPATHRLITISISRYCEARVFGECCCDESNILTSQLTGLPPAAVDYRLAPDTRFPGQLHDAVAAYMRLTIDLKIPPQNIVR